MADEPNKQDTKNKRRLFEDISIVQVTATALAAVTSMLLSSYIGIAGSVIGVAVASVVSTTAASLYKHFLRESTEKIKEIPVVDKTHNIIEHMTSAIGIDKHDEHDSLTNNCTVVSEQSEDKTNTVDEDKPSTELHKHQQASVNSIPIDELSIQANAVTLPISELEDSTNPIDLRSIEDASNNDDDKIDVEAEHVEDAHGKSQENDSKIRAALIAKRRMKIGLIVVCVVSALIAVALSAVVVYVSSQGQGIGAKPQSIFVPLAASESSNENTHGSLDLFRRDDQPSSSSDSSSSNASSSTSNASSSSDSSSNSSSSSADDSSSISSSADTSTTPGSSDSDASSSSSSEDSAQDPSTT